ncbi:hypothetical protein ACQ4PT_031373 [Festuca glaucescens]
MDSHREVLLEMPSVNETWEKKLQDPSATPVALPLEFLKAITCDFSAEQELGRGGYGVVYKVRPIPSTLQLSIGVLSSGKLIAVKDLVNLYNMGHEKFEKEASSLMGIKHENVVQFVGYCAESRWEMMELQGKYICAEVPKRLLCFEYVCKNSLDKYISDESPGLEWNMRYKIIRGICGGLHYLHEECRIVHLDLKPANILMDATMMPKIADFGLSRIFGVQQSRIITQNRPGTLGYMAPEYIFQGAVSIKADIFSLGVIIIEIITGSRDYPLSGDNSPQSTETSFQKFKEKILEIWRNRLQRLYGDTILLEQIQVCVELGIQCIAFKPGKRPVTKHMLGMLDDVNIMDGSIKTRASCTSAVVEISRGGAEECEGHHAKLMDVSGETGAADIKSEINELHSIPDEGEPSTTWVARSDKVNKHHVLESMLFDGSVEPTCLELSLLEEITDSFSSDREIARSRLGVVYKGILSNGSTVVVKRLAIVIAVGHKLFLQAVNSLMSVKHRNIVRFLGYCAIAQGKEARKGGKMVMVIVRERLLCFEYLCNGNLQMHLADESCGLDWQARYETIKGICQGLHYLHDDCISHLDLKPDNILFDEKMVPKLLDYGFSRVFSEEIRWTVLKSIEGSMAYMATPEYLAGGEITIKSDIYSLGVIIMQIVTGQNKNKYSNTTTIVESWRSRLELDASKGRLTFEKCYQQVQECVEVGLRCMDHDPANRPITRYIIDRLHKTETEHSGESGISNSPAPWATSALQSAGIKIVLKVPIIGKNCQSSIIRVVSKIKGIKSLDYDSEKSTLTVVGDVDAVVVVTALRKMKHPAQVITVGRAENNLDRRSNYITVHDQESESCTIM